MQSRDRDNRLKASISHCLKIHHWNIVSKIWQF